MASIEQPSGILEAVQSCYSSQALGPAKGRHQPVNVKPRDFAGNQGLCTNVLAGRGWLGLAASSPLHRARLHILLPTLLELPSQQRGCRWPVGTSSLGLETLQVGGGWYAKHPQTEHGTVHHSLHDELWGLGDLEEGRGAVGLWGTGGGAVDGCVGQGGVQWLAVGGQLAVKAVEGCEAQAGKGREETASCWWPDAAEPPICEVPPPGVSKMPSMSNSQSSACSLFT